MKTFVKENWYKLMTGCSMFIFSIGFFIYSITPAHSKPESIDNSYKTSIQVPVNEDGSINVKLSPEQINEIKSSTGGLQKIGNKYFIGCGSGIYYFKETDDHPEWNFKWTKLS
jgi:hypothetical protein